LLLLGGAFGLARATVAQNVQYGPFRMNFGLGVSAEYRDNANTSEHNPKSDVTLTAGPNMTGGFFLPFAGGEEFSLTMSAAYTKSLFHVQQDSFGAPLTATLILPLYVAQWTVLISDAFNFRNDVLESTFAFNRANVKEYSNTASASATKQLGKFATTFAGQRYDTWFPDDPNQEQINYQFSFTPSLTFREGYSVFLRNSYGLVYVNDPNLQDSTGYSIDAGVNGQITPSLSGTISVGWSHSDLSAAGTNHAQQFDGVDSNVTLSYTHPLRPNTMHSLSFYRSPGVTLLLQNSSLTEVTGLSYTISHRLNRYLTLSPNVNWSHLKSLAGSQTLEVADIIQVGFGLQRQFTKHLSGSLGYFHQIRQSNLPNASYDVNDVTISANYAF
jgi:hypothetical protein